MDSVFNKPFGSLTSLGVSYEGSKARSKGRCACCGLPLNDNEMTVHHLLPVHIGGTSLSNTVVVCNRCARYRGLGSFTTASVHLDLKTDYPFLTKNEQLRSIHFMEEALTDFLNKVNWTPPEVGTPDGEIEDSTPYPEFLFSSSNSSDFFGEDITDEADEWPSHTELDDTAEEDITPDDSITDSPDDNLQV